MVTMSIDAIIIADDGADSFSGVSPLRLELNGRTALIQNIKNFLFNGGQLVPPIIGDMQFSWASAPKLNGLYLYSYLVHEKIEVELVNSYYEERDCFVRLLKQTPKIVVISTTFIHSKTHLTKLAKDIRSLAPDVFIIAGGPFVYLSYLLLQRKLDTNYDTESPQKDYLFLEIDDDPLIDLYVVSPNGEKVLSEAIKHIKQNKKFFDLPNLCEYRSGEYNFSNMVHAKSRLAYCLDWNVIPDSVFHAGVVPVQSSMGCPYMCQFCNFTKGRRQSGLKPVTRVVSELRTLVNRGVKYVRFVDDNFRYNGSDINQFCQEMIKHQLDLKWMSFIRASALKEVNFGLLKRAGCVEVQLGLESADKKILTNMKKDANPELYAKVVKGLLSEGINCSCCFIFGFPGETSKTANTTRKFIHSIESIDYDGTFTWSIFPFLLIPLSPIYSSTNRRKYKLSGYKNHWRHKTMNSKEALKEVQNTFFKMENSGPIYRGDNLEMLEELTPLKRKAFHRNRHRLSKLAFKKELSKEDFLSAFGGVFQ